MLDREVLKYTYFYAALAWACVGLVEVDGAKRGEKWCCRPDRCLTVSAKHTPRSKCI
jgi:hypothetical protein